MNQQKIGAFLKELRKQKRLTQEQLAEKCNVSNRTVSRFTFRRRRKQPDFVVIMKRAHADTCDV